MLSALATGASLVVLATATASGAELPNDVSRQLPPGYRVLGSAAASVDGGHSVYIVALGSRRELNSYLAASERAPARPLLVFEQRTGGRYELIGRNDDVVLRADDAGLAGNGCDPFEGGHIAVKGPYFTVENGVSCGDHWTDYVTFRFDAGLRGYVFDNWRYQSWKFNPNDAPDAQALIPDVRRLVRSPKGRPAAFSTWRRPG